ncbi:MAG: carboxypeptidase regulatory-like domain-containing protein, partial [Lutispora sp.]|nr:carboxypeptidase regulatory-like domain-containing protein [Lutispora sp.]
MKTISKLLILILLLTSTMVLGVDAQGTPTVTVESKTVQLGGTFEVNINIANPSGAAGFQLDLKYDPSILEPVMVQDSVDPSRMVPLVKKGSIGSMITSNIDTTNNLIKVIAVGLNGVNTDGLLCKISFTAKAAGSADLQLNNLKLSNDQGISMPANTVNGTITIPQPASQIPIVSPQGGTFAASPTRITITGIGDIYYITQEGKDVTLDQVSKPDATNSTLYSAPIDITYGQRIALKATDSTFTEAVGYVFEVLAKPTSTVESGTYSERKQVSLTTANQGTTIYYTLDNTDPRNPMNNSRKLYMGTFLINTDTTLKATAYKNDVYSELSEYNYTFSLGKIVGKLTYNNAPLAGITVKLKNGETLLKTVNSDSNGDFSFGSLSPATYKVIAGGTKGYTEKHNIVDIALSDIKTSDFDLLKGGTIVGKVQNEEGTPLSGITVYASAGSTDSGYYTYTVTDTNGLYRIEGLKNGTFKVYTQNNLGMIDDAKENITITLGKLEDLKLYPLTLKNPPIATLTGTVTEGGQPISELWVSTYNYDTGYWAQVQTNAQGIYSINDLTPGNYDLNYYKWENDDQISGYVSGVNLVQGSNTYDITIPAGITLTGKVTDNSDPAVGLGGVNVYLWGDGYGSATTDENGNYTIKRLTPGNYTLEVESSNTFYVDTRTDKKLTLSE